ncbi:MAG: TldD/PmbA family protein [Clostridiales bacterium]|nr:TldD/PmbA family protein [Clostridiales bacterium]
MDIHVFLDRLMARAAREDFEAFEAYYVAGSEFNVGVFGGEIVEYNVSSSLGLSFRALIGRRMGYASTQVLDEEALEMLIDGARDNARLIENEDEQFIYDGAGNYQALDAYNPAIDAMTAAEKIEQALKLEKAALSIDPRVAQVQQCGLMSVDGERRIVNSRGVNLRFRDNGYGFWVFPFARDGDKTATGGKVCVSRDPSALDVERAAREAVREAIDGLTAGAVPPGRYRVALRNDVAADLLSTFSSVFSADAAQRGLSLLRDREGSAIASDALTIVDDPLSLAGLASSPFDGEGVPTARRAIVDRGVLTTLLHNLKTAKKQGVATTGHASRPSYASPVGVAPSNFYIEPSAEPAEALYARLGDGLLITELSGLHSGANQVSGDFSLGAKGYLIQQGAIARPVNQITVAGNFFALLKDVEMVAGDLQFGMPGGSCTGSPTILVSSLAVAGA